MNTGNGLSYIQRQTIAETNRDLTSIRVTEANLHFQWKLKQNAFENVISEILVILIRLSLKTLFS